MITVDPWYSSGTNGIGGQGITLRIPRQRVGRLGQDPRGAGDRRRRGGQDQHPARDLGDRVQPVVEARRDAQVAAAAADRPEQVGLVVGVDDVHLAVRGHDLDPEQVVDREAVAPDEVADPAAEREARRCPRSPCRRTRSRGRARRPPACRRSRSARRRPRRSGPRRRSRASRGRGRRGRSRPRPSSARRRSARRPGRPARGRSRGRGAMTPRTSSVPATRTITAGWRSTPPSRTVRASS